MNTKCYPVKIESYKQISEKCLIVKTYDGKEDFIPTSQIFGWEEHNETTILYISKWILEKKQLQYSTKKPYWFNSHTGGLSMEYLLPKYEVKIHKPIKIKYTENEVAPDESLIR